MAVVLPYPDMDFVPLDILTAAEQDQLVANIEYLAGLLPVGTSEIGDGAVTTAKIDDGAVTSQKIDWTTIDLGWKYLGEEKLTSASNTITFTFPDQYDCYRIVFGGQMTSTTSAGNWLDFLWQNGTTTIKNTHQRLEYTGASALSSIVNTDVTFALNAGAAGVNAYDGINIDIYSIKTDSTQWRKYQGNYYRAGNGITTIICNGRFVNATEPTRVRLQTGGSFNIGSTIKAWGCNV